MSFQSPPLGNAAKDSSLLTQLLQLAFDSLQDELRKADPVGRVSLWPGLGDPPEGWVPCDGGTYNRTKYPELYATIGTTFGSGSGTFDVPDLTASAPADHVYMIRAE